MIEAVDPKDLRIAELERENAELKRVISTLMARVQVLESLVQDLQARLAANSSNSSRPPSSDPPGAAPPKQPATPSGLRRGGQPGHPRHERRLLPPERVTQTTTLLPPACRRCGKSLHGRDPAPHQHQVVEIPRLLAQAHVYWLHSLPCEDCHICTRAVLPAGVPAGCFGPRLQAMIAVCSGRYHLSKRMIAEMMGDFFDADLSLGSISQLEADTSAALAAPVALAAAHVQAQPVQHADETGCRTSGLPEDDAEDTGYLRKNQALESRQGSSHGGCLLEGNSTNERYENYPHPAECDCRLLSHPLHGARPGRNAHHWRDRRFGGGNCDERDG